MSDKKIDLSKVKIERKDRDNSEHAERLRMQVRTGLRGGGWGRRTR